MTVLENAYAKINLYLDVIRRRDDGFHDINSVMHTVTLCDMISLTSSPSNNGRINITSDVSGLENGENNLIYKSAVKYIRKFNINDNLDKKITLDSLSKASNFSKSYICNEFKLHMKTPIIQYVRKKKILAAHKMIEAGSRPYQVAKQFGFDDYSTFYRSYLSIIGHPPGDQNFKSLF